MNIREQTVEAPVLYAADLTGCDALGVLAVREVSGLFTAALRDAGATVVQEVSQCYGGGHGLTCVLVLRESHAVLHTWPETGTVNVDIFSCSNRLKSVVAIMELGRLFGARHIEVRETPRADGHSRAPVDPRR